jgi:hypothetical protein
MGFVVGGCEIGVTADGLIHLVELVMAALGVDREAAVGEIKGMVEGRFFPDVRCLKREGCVLVTSGGAEDVLVRLVRMGKVFKGDVVMGMRCFMSQNGPFAHRIREGTESIPVRELCPGPAWGEEPVSNAQWDGRLLSDTAWSQPVFIERGGGDSKEEPLKEKEEETVKQEARAYVGEEHPLDRHRTRLTDLELDQLEGATEMQAREGQREHFARVLAWYRELCEDTVMDEAGKGFFKGVLMGMLPGPGRAWADRRAREAWRRGVDGSLD